MQAEVPLTKSAPAPRTIAGAGWISHAAWLGDDLLVLVGWFDAAAGDKVALTRGRRKIASLRWLAVGSGDHPSEVGVGVVAVPGAEAARQDVGQLLLVRGRQRTPIAPAEIANAITDLQTLVREGLAWLDAASRSTALQFLVAETSGRSPAVGASLHLVREGVRERLRPSVTEASERTVAHVDQLLRLDAGAFYVEGWARTSSPSARITAVSPEGARADLGGLYRYSRPDVAAFFGLQPQEAAAERLGFVGYFELEAPSRLDDGWLLELRAGAAAVEAPAPPAAGDLDAARSTILGDLVLERLPSDDLRRHHIRPALTRIQDLIMASARIADVQQYGVRPVRAAASIVVPLYRRIDFLEHQLAQFVHDPEVRASDLIYVLDSPEQAEQLEVLATQLHRLYGVPFRVAVLNRNCGFSAVNNLGAELAEAPHLLLLNSDVLPSRPGWLGRLASFYEATPRTGAVAPKLLYEDDSLQHAGLYFDRPVGAHVWTNEHYFKGLHGSFPPANVTRRVPAVTAACMLISSDLYRSLGGLRGVYVRGDYEDSDLCLRLREEGYDTWYLHDVELYHLEGQSYDSATRAAASEYNSWLHTQLWAERLESLGGEHDPAPRPKPRRRR